MISVDAALEHLFALVEPLGSEEVDLRAASGRVLARPVLAERNQPPFAASAMDGYAIKDEDYKAGAQLRLLGESAAGSRYAGSVGAGETVRIFTGAPVPEGASRVVIQEDVTAQGDQITIRETTEDSRYIRPAGTDFKTGDTLTASGPLTPQHIALLASMNVARVPVMRQPKVALMSTGSELVMPGENPGPDQIIASNTFGLAAMLEAQGAQVQILPIAHDTPPALTQAFKLAQGADLIVTIGGASVGDHDLVADVAEQAGLQRSFYKVAMRPGKPLMAGRLGQAAMIGLPGNPVSAMVCGVIFVLPLLRALQGLGKHPATHLSAPLAAPIKANGPRAHYMRGALVDGALQVFDRQDSALLSVLASANVLVLSPPHDRARVKGEQMSYIPL